MVASDSHWPPVAWEQHSWTPTVPPDLVARRVRQRHTGPYRAAVVPRIADLDVPLPAEATAAADAASVEIARFDAEFGSDMAPFSALLLRSESVSSSQIEGLTSSARALALAELDQADRSNAIQIVANVRAMEAAIALADRLDEDAILAMHAALMAHDREHEPGQWRRQQVWIGGTSYGPHLADFVPPHDAQVPDAMADLVAFMGRDDVPALPLAALAHAQFETIHPFTDGNGRTGRALIHALLRAKGLCRGVTLPVSAGLLTNTPAYFTALDDYRRGDAATIVRLMAEASLAAVANGRQLMMDLAEVRHRWGEVVRARQDAAVWQVADLLMRQPVINAPAAHHALGRASANVHRAIRQLVEAGVLVEFSGRQRERLWQAPEVLSALDDFAARAGRRIR